MDITFLKAAVPLTKTYIKKADGSIEKSSYPHVSNFTSITESVADMKQLETLMRKHAALGHTLLKGHVAQPLNNESRKGSTDTNEATEWIVFDVDGLPGVSSVDQFLAAIGFMDVSYVVQYSASYGIENKDLRAHAFMQLAKPMAAPLLKQWLMDMNHRIDMLRNAMTLTKTGNGLSWPLDITACQNDKLIYIAPPLLKGGIKDPMGAKSRITYVPKKNAKLDIKNLIPSTEANREKTHKRINELREQSGLPARKHVYKMIGANQVLVRPDSATISDMKVDRGFVYFNLNGGNSWGYWHPENNPDFIFNFKGEATYLTKELLPEYWEQLTSASTPKTSSAGLTYLVMLDKRSSTYFRGTYDKNLDNLEVYAAKNETQIRHFAKQNGVPLGDFIPEWDLIFDPHYKGTRVDPTQKIVNLYEPTQYGKAKTKKVTVMPPTIRKVIHHAVGSDDAIFEHFINWLACVFQFKTRTLTAWVLHGVEGCLAGDTVIDVRRGCHTSGREITIKQAYEKWSGIFKRGPGLGKTWDMSIPTFSKSVKDGMTIGYHEVYDIVEAGIKQLYKLTTNTGRTIRVTDIHPFMRGDGSFTELRHLRISDQIVVEGDHNDHIAAPRGRNKQRKTTYSIQYHPHAWQHIIDGKDYKRSHTARLVVEADMNKLTMEEFVHILRNDPVRAAQLVYLAEGYIVHHVDENPANDGLSNLEVIEKLNHDAHHAKEVGLGTINTKLETITSLEIDALEMTYDMTMKAPYQNYVANGFAVHNTGKGALMNNIIRPILGTKQTASRHMEELNEKYNHWMENCFVAFIDEIEAKALDNEKGVAARLRNWITEPTINIRAMQRGAYEVDNYCNMILASNKPDPVVLTQSDRRYNVAKFQPHKLVLTAKEWDEKIESELQAFHDYMMTYKADKKLAATVLETEDRNTMISISETSIDVAVSRLHEGDLEFFVDQLPSDDRYKLNPLRMSRVEDYKYALLSVLDRTDPNTGTCNISRDELQTIFSYMIGNVPETPNKFTSMLKHHRVHMSKVWIGSRAVAGIKTTWRDAPGLAALREILSPTAVSSAKVTSIKKARTK